MAFQGQGEASARHGPALYHLVAHVEKVLAFRFDGDVLVAVAHLHVRAVVGLQRVLDGVLRRPVALVHKHVRERGRQSFPRERVHRREGPHGRVGDVVVIGVLRGVRAVAVVLERAGEQQAVLPVARAHGHVHAHAPRVAVVQHRPLVGAFQRQAHDAVFHVVVIPVGLDVEPAVGVRHAEVELAGVFGAQVPVSHERVVQVVERGRAEDALVEPAQHPPPEGVGRQRVPREARQRFGGPAGPVGDAGVQSARVQAQPFVGVGRRQRSLAVEAVNVVEVLDVRREVRPPEVRGGRKPEPLVPIASRQGRIHVLLVIAVVGVHRDILRVVGTIMQEIVGVFDNPPQARRAQLLLVRQLREEVAVPFPPHVGVGVRQAPHDAARKSPPGIEIIRVPLQPLVESASFDAEQGDVGVAAAAGRVLIFGVVVEGIVAPRACQRGVDEGILLVRSRQSGLVRAERADGIGGGKAGAVRAAGLQVDG